MVDNDLSTGKNIMFYSVEFKMWHLIVPITYMRYDDPQTEGFCNIFSE